MTATFNDSIVAFQNCPRKVSSGAGSMHKELRLLAPICGAVFLSVLGIAQNVSTQTTAVLPSSAKVKVDFARDIEPILKDRCQSCHGSSVQSGGLRLDSRAGAMAGGNSGAVIKLGDSAGSKLIQLVAGARERPGDAPHWTAAHRRAGGAAARLDRSGR